MLELECQIVEMFHWSLAEIDETDVETLLPFVFYWPKYLDHKEGREQVFVDQVSWL